MNTNRCGALVAAALGWALLGGAAFAQSTPPDSLAPGAGAAPGADPAKDETQPKAGAVAKPERKTVRAKPRDAGSVTVEVHNGRSVGMMELRVGPTGSPELKKVVGALAFGRKTTIHLRRTKDCLYDIHAQFADEADSDQTSVDLCTDKAINLTD